MISLVLDETLHFTNLLLNESLVVQNALQKTYKVVIGKEVQCT